ncbi:LptE family protein [Zhouia sp. PK063]|uniref:LptE family protein n=1 Tax=Zhouia sp. PK063 TaxID=3373602 RepID=UPI00379FDA2A
MIKKAIYFSISLVIAFCMYSCGVYNFTGGSTGNAKTFQVNYFQNTADIVEPGLDRQFTVSLQDFIQNQTNLSLTTSGADIVFEGEIVDYTISPMSATAQQTAAQNRLTIAVQVTCTNNTDHEKDFNQRFSFYYDYPAASQINAVKDEAFQEIFDRIEQDIFNKAFNDW